MAVEPMFKEGFGAETEYAPQPIPALKEKDRCYRPALFNHHAIVHPRAFPTLGVVAGESQYHGKNLHLLNGGRVYCASLPAERVEYATPECRTLDEIVYAVLAGNYLMPQVFNQLDQVNRFSEFGGFTQPAHTHTVIASNADHVVRYATSVHENYTLPKGIPTKTREHTKLYQKLIPFLLTRQIYAGAGYISPRGDFFLSPAAYGQRFGSSHRHKERLHLQLGDCNMSPDAIRLKFGATLCLIEAIARGWQPRTSFSPLTPNELFSLNSQITSTMNGPNLSERRFEKRPFQKGYPRWAFEAGDQQYSALYIQYECLDAIDYYLKDALNPDIQWVRQALRTTLNALGQDDIHAPWLDWTVKYDQYQRGIGDKSLQRRKDLVNLDRSYHYWDMLNPQRSSYTLLAGSHPNEKKITDAISTPPQTTRAKVRGEAVRTLLQRADDPFVAIDWERIRFRDITYPLALDQTESPVIKAIARG